MKIATVPFLLLFSVSLFGACGGPGPGPGGACGEAGAACEAYTDCCSLDCKAGACVGDGACTPAGGPCDANPQCCSGICDVQGVCTG